MAKRPYLLPVVAALIVGMYVLGAVGALPVSHRLMLLPFLALGPLGIVGVLELGRVLSPDGSSMLTRTGTVLGVVAFALWEVVVAVQHGTRTLWREFIVPDLEDLLPGGTETARLLFRGVNAVQATMDVAFDIFYCLSILLLSAVMLRKRRFGHLVGGLGIASAGGLLILNLWSFPRPPAEAGLLDLGPVTGVWWLAVIVLWMQGGKSMRTSPLLIAAFASGVTHSPLCAQQRSIQLSQVVDAAPPVLYTLFTTSEGVRTIFPGAEAHIGDAVGGEYRIAFDPRNSPDGSENGTAGCVILRLDPGRSLAFQWRGPPWAPEMNVVPLPTWVEVTFRPLDDGAKTLVELTHHSFARGGTWDRAYEFFQRAWREALTGLQQRFAERRNSTGAAPRGLHGGGEP